MTMNALTILAAELSPQERNQIMLALAILLVLVVIGCVGIMLFRRKIRDTDVSTNSADAGFSLSSLREMRDRGELTPEEYERARAKVVEKVKSSLAAPADKPGPDEDFGQQAARKKPT